MSLSIQQKFEAPAMPRSDDGRRRKPTRIQSLRQGEIIKAGLKVFARYGFKGATIDQIAEKAGMSKTNLLYYYRCKEDIYLSVLQRTLEMWIAPLEEMRADGDPALEIRAYIARKIRFSREHAVASRVFAMEILQGAPNLERVIRDDIRAHVEERAAVIRAWADAGKIRKIDPYHLFFTIWAATQTYADFSSQIAAILDKPALDGGDFDAAEETLCDLILNGLLPG